MYNKLTFGVESMTESSILFSLSLDGDELFYNGKWQQVKLYKRILSNTGGVESIRKTLPQMSFEIPLLRRSLHGSLRRICSFIFRQTRLTNSFNSDLSDKNRIKMANTSLTYYDGQGQAQIFLRRWENPLFTSISNHSKNTETNIAHQNAVRFSHKRSFDKAHTL